MAARNPTKQSNRIGSTLEETFWLNVAKADDNGCWLWQGRTMKGYGSISLSGRNMAAHRLSYEMAFGAIPDGLWVLHKCDIRACVRPDHLFLDTVADNAADMTAKGRSANGERHGRAKLTEESVRAIRQLYQARIMTGRQLAARFQVSKQAISDIVRGVNWKSGLTVDTKSHKPLILKIEVMPKGGSYIYLTLHNLLTFLLDPRAADAD